MSVDTLEPKAITPKIIAANSLSTQLVSMGITRAMIEEKAAKYNSLVIAGPDDKEGEELAKKARRTLVTTRTSIDKKREELNADALLTQRTNNALAKELTVLIEEIEKPLDAKIKAVEAEREAIKAQKLADEAAKFTARVNSLHAIGAKPVGSSFDVFGVMIDAIEIKEFPDAEWQDLYASAEFAFQNEQDRLLEVAKAEEKEKQRIAAEQETERQRLAAVATAQAAQALLLQQQQAAFEQQQREQEEQRTAKEKQQAEAAQKQQDELNKLILDARVSRLEGLGFVRGVHTTGPAMLFDGRVVSSVEGLGNMSAAEFEEYVASHCNWVADMKIIAELLESRKARLLEIGFEQGNRGLENPDHILTDESILDPDDDEFDRFIKTTKEMADLRIQREQEAATFELRIGTVADAGFTKNSHGFYFYGEQSLTVKDISSLPDNEFAHIIKIAKQAQAQAAHDKMKADKARTARLKSDKSKLLDYITTVGSTPNLALTEAETLDLYIEFEKSLKVLINDFSAKVEAL
ncbi:hypothetical protein GCM10028808_72890 [Spirosoma migulaei]